MDTKMSENKRKDKNWLYQNETGDARDYVPTDNPLITQYQSAIISYGILMFASGLSSITLVLLYIKRQRAFPTMENTVFLYFTTLHLLVTFLMMPIELAWAAEVHWNTADELLRTMLVFRVLGLLLFTLRLICLT